MSGSPASSPKLVYADTISDVRSAVRAARKRQATVGCVPTMGALHKGHQSLICTAREECQFVVVTLFVNPTQFGPGEDYLKYPRSLDDDLQQCSDMGVDIVFVPSADLMYPSDFSTHVDVEGLSNVLEGAFRPGHFRGVATVVLKLLNIVQPDRVYFGQKDFQQQRLISKMCDDLNVPVQIRVCPTVREPDGLALSSRNAYLNPEERQSALALRESLRMAEERLAAGETDVDAVRAAMRAHLDRAPGVLTDYATIVHPMTLEEVDRPVPEMVAVVAARVGATRLIDNLALKL